jgi:hypothetical protein
MDEKLIGFGAFRVLILILFSRLSMGMPLLSPVSGVKIPQLLFEGPIVLFYGPLFQ